MEHSRDKYIAAIKEYIRKRDERWASMTPEAVKQECRDYLVSLGINNPDGTITPEYGGPQPT